MSANIGTREILLNILNDVEMISKEAFESIIMMRNQKLNPTVYAHLGELLIQKDREFKATLLIATEQAEIQKKIDALQVEVEKQDQDIHQLQKYLKEAEHMLATAVYQAKQKLQCIAKCNEKSVSVDDLIKYAHRISCSYAVAAPHNWQPGDPRRPYPTDIEMRLGLLGRLSDLPMSGNLLQQQQQASGIGDMPVQRGPHGEPNQSAQVPFTWPPSSDLKSSMAGPGSQGMAMDSKSQQSKEDVDVMSTESSSSSSSDSQ